MEIVGKFLGLLFDFVLFVILSVLFIPAFFIVTYLQPIWQEKLKSLFNF